MTTSAEQSEEYHQKGGGTKFATESAKIVADSALALFGLFLVVVGFDSFPPRLLDPIWLITASSVLVNSVSIPLAGVLFTHIAAIISPHNNALQERRRRISRLARLAAFGYLLLIPLLAFATWRGVTNVNQGSLRQAAVITRNADRLNKAIDSASSSLQLQQAMVRLQGPQISDRDLAVPLEQLKGNLRGIIAQLRQRFISELPKPDSEAYKPLYLQALRAAVLALVSSIGFAALSWDPLKQQSLLQAIVSPANRAALRPGNLGKRIGTLVAPLLAPFKSDPSRQSRKRFWSDLRDKEKRASALRAKEIKRNAERLRKAQQERERKRRLEERKRERERQRQRRRSADDDDS